MTGPTITPRRDTVEHVEPLVKSTRPPHPLVIEADDFLARADLVLATCTIEHDHEGE